MVGYVQTMRDVMDPISQGPNSPQGVKSSREYALALLKDSQAPVNHWAQGIGNIVKALQGGYTEYSAGEQERTGQTASNKALLAALGINTDSPSPTAPPMQQPMAPQSQGPQFAAPPPPPNPMLSDLPTMSVSDAPMAAPQANANMPRGMRNNNPGNIEDGPFARNLPGYVGGDGRFAKFASLDDGNAAMEALLKSYGNRGINTPDAIINRWAPPSDNNPTKSYAANVARALGVEPNAQVDLNNPQTLAAIRTAITRQENGPTASLPQGPVSAAPASTGVAPQSSPAATPPINRQALAQILNDPWASPEAKAMVLKQLGPRDPIKLGKDDRLVDPRSFQTLTGNTGPDFAQTGNLRKEIADSKEYQRYGQAAPIFQSMVKSAANNTAAADLDFVYGIAKIFDPESVVREGEMKLAAGAQSIPQQLQGWMAQVVNGQGRLTPEQRQALLEVSSTRMNELKGALDLRLQPYEGIVKRNNINRDDVFPGIQPLAEVPRAPQVTPPPAVVAPPPKPDAQGWQTLPNGVRIRERK